MDIVKSVIVELRPRLRCCNIFLRTTSLLIQDHLNLTIRPDCIVVSYSKFPGKSEERHTSRKRRISRHDSTSSCESYSDSEDESLCYNKFMDMKPFCRLVPGSLSNLRIESNAVSFRVLSEPIEPNCSGDFYSETLHENRNDVADGNRNRNRTPNLDTRTSVSLHCGNCSNELMSSVSFERILELPSETVDISDWFCHGVNGHCHAEKKSEAAKACNYARFTPSSSDVFYGVCFFIVADCNFIDCFKKFNLKRDLIHCNRCLSCLGSKHDVAAYKFWNSCVKFSKIAGDPDGSVAVDFNLFTCDFENNLALSDCLCLVKSLIKDSLIGFQMPFACKMVLECEGNNKQCLLIWVMDRCLDVLKTVEDDSNMNNSADLKQIKLERVSAVKLLYNICNESNISNEWKDPAIQVHLASKSMVQAALAHFVKNSLMIPENCRSASGYNVSYIFL